MKLREVWREWSEKEEFGPVMVPLRMDELIQKEQERDRAARYVLMNLPTMTLLSEAYLSGGCDERRRGSRIQLDAGRDRNANTNITCTVSNICACVRHSSKPIKNMFLADFGRSNARHETRYRGERKLARQVLP